MNKDNRISALPSAIKLSALELNPFPSQFVDTGSEDEDVLFLIAKAGEKNEKINFKNLKSSILDSSVLLSGDQTIEGKKTFRGDVTFSGNLFADNIFVKNDLGEWEKAETTIQIVALPEEAVSFNEQLHAGSQKTTIDLPKTFEQQPVISVTLLTNGPNIPFTISSITESQFEISFVAALPENFDYSIDITARAQGSSMVRQTKTVAFSEDLTLNNSQFEISFPETFDVPPVLSLTTESEHEIIPFSIKSISTNSFSVQFSAKISSATKLHVQATR